MMTWSVSCHVCDCLLDSSVVHITCSAYTTGCAIIAVHSVLEISLKVLEKSLNCYQQVLKIAHAQTKVAQNCYHPYSCSVWTVRTLRLGKSFGSLWNFIMDMELYGTIRILHFALFDVTFRLWLLLRPIYGQFGPADWHELMIPWRIMRPSIACYGEQLDPRCSTQTYHRPNQPSSRSPWATIYFPSRWG